MALPEQIRVKLSSEAAGSIAVTPVVAREMPLRELVEQMLGLTGKNADRVRELLRRGTLVSGASRFRWSGFETEAGEVEALLATFPDPEPHRAFQPERCVLAVYRSGTFRIEVTREAGSARRLFRRRSYWDELMALAASAAPEYVEYSYKERADLYRIRLDAVQAQALKEAARLLKYASLAEQIVRTPMGTVELSVVRDSV